MSATTPRRAPRLTAVLRQESAVTPLELFFDLVFVLALTQCTQLMADSPTWTGLAKGLLVLGIARHGASRSCATACATAWCRRRGPASVHLVGRSPRRAPG